MKRLLDRVNGAIGACCRIVLYASLTVTFLILSINVALRYAAGSSLAWASELPELLFPWMIMSGVVLAAQHGSHIAVVILTQRLRGSRRWVLGGGSLLVSALYLGLSWAALPLMEIAADERSPILQVPGSLTVACLLIGFVLLAVVNLCQLPLVWRAASSDADAAPADRLEGATS
ncbi:TRAP transporter small permease [Leptothrix discophora]|uniref:TRAP transporter small permease protein n=1 Tax=Leptothrix discophora TaxID=89 RepID=A0ABT9FZA4_LEPDI|nr:TRAP transporter small permease subunit [Leptothrix discophora]MDP4299372.1 TRAP transporter small permease subunit [Leptothrix discophora]